jgi:hypothetical protein
MIAASMALVLLVPILVFAAGVLFGYWRRQSIRVTDPSCGKCRYIVRGLEGDICPECGSDLRAVGILQPGAIEPLSRGKRVLLWLFVAPVPTLILFLILMPLCVPQWLKTTQRRVIFSQTTYCNAIITANTEGKQLIFGQPPFIGSPTGPKAPPEVVFLSNGAMMNMSMDIRLPAKTFRYSDKSGKVVTGQFDAKGVEKWLNDQGFNDPRVADRAADIVATTNEIGTPAGTGFTKFATEGNRPTGIAHPTFTFTRVEPNELTFIAPFVVFAVVWLAGLPFVWRNRRSTNKSSPPMSDQTTAETAVLR